MSIKNQDQFTVEGSNTEHVRVLDGTKLFGFLDAILYSDALGLFCNGRF